MALVAVGGNFNFPGAIFKRSHWRDFGCDIHRGTITMHDAKNDEIFSGMNDRNIWASAKLLVDSVGNDALDVAAARSLELLERGDVKGGALWRRIWSAIKVLQ